MPVRVGFVGVGNQAREHIKCLSRIPDVELVAFCDTRGDRAKAVAEGHGARSYTSYVEMLDTESLDAAYVVVPPFAHSEIEILAAKKGIALFIERPIHVSVEQAEQVLRAIEEAGVINSVGYHMRYYDTCDLVKAEIDRGRIVSLICCSMGSMPGEHWWNVMNNACDTTGEEVSQEIDMARYIAGEVTRVYAQISKRDVTDIAGFELADVGTIALSFESGALAEISNTCLLARGGATGTYIVTRDSIVHFHRSMVKVVRDGHSQEHYSSANPYMAETRAFVDAVMQSDQSRIRSSYSDALATLRVTMAAYESGRTGSRIDLATEKPQEVVGQDAARRDEIIVGAEPVDNPEL
jgi:myo-inositol 2-dehydrogenase/D-chiro-inositol 1-dehydrogenase